MTTANLLDRIIQPADHERRRRCMNKSSWIAFSPRRDNQLPRRTRVSCRAQQGRPLTPSAAGEARAGHARAATARARARAAPLPARAGRSERSCCGRRARDRQVPTCFCLSAPGSGNKLGCLNKIPGLSRTQSLHSVLIDLLDTMVSVSSSYPRLSSPPSLLLSDAVAMNRFVGVVTCQCQ
jgi:hypothetical protein